MLKTRSVGPIKAILLGALVLGWGGTCAIILHTNAAQAAKPLEVGETLELRNWEQGLAFGFDERHLTFTQGEPTITAGRSRCTISKYATAVVLAMMDSGQARVKVDHWRAGTVAFPPGSCSPGSLVKVRLSDFKRYMARV